MREKLFALGPWPQCVVKAITFWRALPWVFFNCMCKNLLRSMNEVETGRASRKMRKITEKNAKNYARTQSKTPKIYARTQSKTK